MEEKKLLKKLYYVTITSFQDAEGHSRRELDIIPAFVYKTSQSVRDERNMHVIWYSNPDPQEYNVWDLECITIPSAQREILLENTFIAEVVAMSEEIQPQEFEQILQRLGFHRA